MTRRIQKLVLTVAALAALALGGAVFAQAQTAPAAAPEHTSAVDGDNVQSGDQTTPDTPKAATTRTARHQALRVSNKTKAADPVGGGTQSGNQSTPDTSSATEKSGAETPETGAGSESSAPNDGPGGHADPAGNANNDHQFQGNE